SIGCGEDRPEPGREQAVAALEPGGGCQWLTGSAAHELGHQGIGHGQILGPEVGAECEAKGTYGVTHGEVYAHVWGCIDLFLTPDVLEIASDRVGFIRGERVQQTRLLRHGQRERAKTVAEAEIVERPTLVRTKLLEGGLRVSTEILSVGERRLVGELHQS